MESAYDTSESLGSLHTNIRSAYYDILCSFPHQCPTRSSGARAAYYLFNEHHCILTNRRWSGVPHIVLIDPASITYFRIIFYYLAKSEG